MKTRSDFDSDKKIKFVKYLASEKSFYVVFWNDKGYRLSRDSLNEIDDKSSEVVKVEAHKSGQYFLVSQSSGHKYEVPWDLILHHCEPAYEYFKGNQDVPEAEGQNKKIGKKIKSMRKSRGMTASQLAKLSGMKNPNLSRLEAGSHSPSVDTLEKVAKALDVPIAAFFE